MIVLLQAITARDGVRMEASELALLLARACTEGEVVACALAPLDARGRASGDRALGDRAAVARALAPLCEQGSALACLGQAWAEMPLSGSGVAPQGVPDPARVWSLVKRACDAGLQRACTELGTFHALGIGTYPGPRQAEDLWAASCDAGEPHACTLLGGALFDRSYLEDGLQGGDAAGWLVLADTFPVEREIALQRACEAGATAGCVALAERALLGSDLASARSRLGAACTMGDPVACAWVLRVDASVGMMSRSVASDGLRQACPVVPWACEQADFLPGTGPIHLTYPGEAWSDRDVGRAVFDQKAKLDRCADEWLTREPRGAGVVDLVLQVEDSGEVSGVHVASAPDSAHGACVAAIMGGVTLHAPAGGPARIEAALPVYHGAEVKFYPLFPGEGIFDVARLTLDAPAWAVPSDRCLLETVGPEPDMEMTLRFQVLRDGTVRSISVMESSEEPKLDQCLMDWLAGHRFIEPVSIPLAAKARVRFLRYRESPIDTEPLSRASSSLLSSPLRAPPPPAAPTPIRVLVLRVPRAILEGRPAQMSKAAKTSIALLHEELAQVVADYTHGAVVLETTVRDVQATVTSVQHVGDEFVAEPWLARADNLERGVVEAIEAGRWDAVFVWVPTAGYPQAPVSATLDATTVRGATLSVLPIPGGRPVAPPHGLPPWELPLRALWRQTLARADRVVGVELPLDTVPLEVERHLLDPRSWNDQPSHSVLGWYAETLGYRVHPELWKDLWPRDGRVSGNLAQQGRPVGEGILHLEGLNDTLVDLGRFANLPSADPDASADPNASEVSFGLEWRSPVRFGMVVAHVGASADPSRPSFRDPVLEILGPDLQGWTPVEARRTVEGSQIWFILGPVEAYGVRLRVVDGAVAPVCRELEVR